MRPVILGLGAVAALGGLTFARHGEHAPGMLLAAVSPSCDIKGNLSPNTGDRIYHVPGQDHYDETRISYEQGERWFCTEAEARAAGWRRARSR